MSPRHFLVLVTALVALALPASASGALFPQGEIGLSTITLEGSNGHEVEVSSVELGRRTPGVAVTFKKDLLTTSYEVPDESGAGLRATFGSLGSLDLRFQRRRRMVDRPEPNCRWVIELGVFRGSLAFTGEGGYSTVQATDPEGEIFRLPDGFCGLESFRRGRAFLPGLYETVLAARMEDGARTISFEASRFKGSRKASFSASLLERIGRMKVERTARASGAKASFSHTKASRAGVLPPPPFSGEARFSDATNGPANWTGSLSVSFLGAPEVPLAGEAFTAKICPRLRILTRCLRPRRGLYGSGSHSQPLALAKLSSLR